MTPEPEDVTPEPLEATQEPIATEAAQEPPEESENPPEPGTATPEPYATVDQQSDSQAVLKMQQRLHELGWLRDKQLTSVYDEETQAVILGYQRYINTMFAGSLEESGIADSATQVWLYMEVQPTPQPTGEG